MQHLKFTSLPDFSAFIWNLLERPGENSRTLLVQGLWNGFLLRTGLGCGTNCRLWWGWFLIESGWTNCAERSRSGGTNCCLGLCWFLGATGWTSWATTGCAANYWPRWPGPCRRIIGKLGLTGLHYQPGQTIMVLCVCHTSAEAFIEKYLLRSKKSTSWWAQTRTSSNDKDKHQFHLFSFQFDCHSTSIHRCVMLHESSRSIM